jgi:hypothetical protein
MGLFPLPKNKDNSDYIKVRNDLRLARYKELLKTSSQLYQIQDQNEEILSILEEMRNKGTDLSQIMQEGDQSQGKKAVDQIESLIASVIETNYKLEELDKRLINNMSAVLSDFQSQLLTQNKEESLGLQDNYYKLLKKVKGNRGFLWLLFLLQLIALGGIAFIILYLMDYIYF